MVLVAGFDEELNKVRKRLQRESECLDIDTDMLKLDNITENVMNDLLLKKSQVLKAFGFPCTGSSVEVFVDGTERYLIDGMLKVVFGPLRCESKRVGDKIQFSFSHSLSTCD